MGPTQIRLEQLIPGRWYVGRDRTSNVAVWTGEHFVTLGDEGGQEVTKIEGYYTAETGCFQPFHLSDEGENVEPVRASESGLG